MIPGGKNPAKSQLGGFVPAVSAASFSKRFCLLSSCDGFTLIELLVVVLIIGILSAIALPQYTKAVEKSRAATAEALLASMRTAGEECVLNTGNASKCYLLGLDGLSLAFPVNSDGENGNEYFQCRLDGYGMTNGKNVMYISCTRKPNEYVLGIEAGTNAESRTKCLERKNKACRNLGFTEKLDENHYVRP